MDITNMTQERIKYLKLLSKQFPTVSAASEEIINLEAICNLPKGTEHFLSDVHGEHEAFLHILKNGSGVIRRKIDDSLGNAISAEEKQILATLIYYPEETLRMKQHDENWYHRMLKHLVLVCRETSSKYTRSKVRKALPEGFEYILEELLHEQETVEDKEAYYDQIIKTIVSIEQGDAFVKAICELIQRFAIDRLHIIGDVYDRGDGPHIIMDKLMEYHSVDFQWGNHDIVWMGAYAGSLLCIANVIRISLRYGNHQLLDDYGINMLPLARFAEKTYKDVEESFMPKHLSEFDKQDMMMIAQMQKAITMIMFKLEGHFIERDNGFEMGERLLLNYIDYDNNTIELEGKAYELNWRDIPTIDPKRPYHLTPEEMEVILKLKASFTTSEKLKSHVDFLFEKGGIYKVYNNNLLYHGCIPTNTDGSFVEVELDGHVYKGKALLDEYEHMARRGYNRRFTLTDETELDIFYYLWAGPQSSLFGKHVMKTFERQFIDDASVHKEVRNPYYLFNEDADYCDKIFDEFGMNKNIARIINGHVPVKVGKGESPVKANGKMIVIDGGLSKAYQKVTDIAGYTLIFNSHGLSLAEHRPFNSARDSIEHMTDLISEVSIIYTPKQRIFVSMTDGGKKLLEDIVDLKELLYLYKEGVLKEGYRK